MKLNEIPFDRLTIGQKVQSLITGNFGEIDQLINVSDSVMDYGCEISIMWENGKNSYQPQMFLENVIVVE